MIIKKIPNISNIINTINKNGQLHIILHASGKFTAGVSSWVQTPSQLTDVTDVSVK